MRKTIKTETMYGLWRVKATVRKWLGINRVDGDYWAEAEDMTKTTPYECEIPVGLIWDIAAFLKEFEA